MGSTSQLKGPAQAQLQKLDSVFGPEYFEHGRLVLTVARDVAGMMKVGHKLQSKVNEKLGAVVEVIMEHVKHEMWAKLHDTTQTVGLYKGNEVPDCQVTDIPAGIREHPYKREHLPTLEVLLLWNDAKRVTRGHCLYTCAHPDTPSLDQVETIFAEIQSYFAKRWVIIELCLGDPVKGELDDPDGVAEAEAVVPQTPIVGAGVDVTILACHAYGFAREPEDGVAPHVRHCLPLPFRGQTDMASRAKICFLPAEINKIQVADTEQFHGTEVTLRSSEMLSLDQGPTWKKVTLFPKALAAVVVHVFMMPSKVPDAEETDGVIDWASEERVPLPDATVEISAMKPGAAPIKLTHVCDGQFVPEGRGLPEGFVNLVAMCSGYYSEERDIMLLVGSNQFFLPLRKLPSPMPKA